MQKVEIKVISKLPEITGNFEAVEKELSVRLKQFDLIVDEDGIKDAKATATAINKLSGKIDELRKSEIKKLSAPIKAFEEKAKALTALCQESRQKLLSQVKVFEDRTRTECLTLLQAERDNLYSKFDIRDEFKTVTVEDLATVSNKNKTGLAKKARDTVEERVFERKQFQEKVDTRLLTLEGTCYKNGLQAPLTRENINHFLLEPEDDVYESKLNSLIANEIDRLRAMEKRSRAEDAYTAPKTTIISKTPSQSRVNVDTSSKYANYKNNVFAKPSAKKSYTVTATFEIEIEEKYEAKLADMLLKKFRDGGFKTIPSVMVTKGVEDEQSAA